MKRLARKTAGGILFLISLCVASLSQTPEQRTARRFDSIKNQPSLLLAFLREMPKGGDLHNHLLGALYAENLIDYAVESGLCVDRTTSTLLAPPCDNSCDPFASKPLVKCAYGDHVLYGSIIDAWSMRNWTTQDSSGHDHFFATFDKFGLATRTHVGEALAEVSSRAADDHLQYLELMHTADGGGAASLGRKVWWDENLSSSREKLLAAGIKDVVASTRAQLDQDESRRRALLKCDTSAPEPGCDVSVRYLYQVLRGLPPESVFAQILLGFELAQADPRFVGLNLVMPEDWYVPMHDFELHMKMLDYLHDAYPKVHISLHAGELAMGLVPPEGLRFHVRDSVEHGHAERIGHGVSVMNEQEPVMLQEMAKRNVLVEICLTSNAVILGVEGKEHPLATYLKYGVPVALATDDEGVSRSDMTHEYLRAAEDQGLSYLTLKTMARQSLEHSFLPGKSLWSGGFAKRSACTTDRFDAPRLSANCTRFLNESEKAREQWVLESEFAVFEKKF